MMIFAVMRIGLDTNRKQAQGSENTTIDSKIQFRCFIMACLFFLDFVSAWFDGYSKYFAGNRFDTVSNVLERMIQKVYELPIIFVLVGVFSEMYFVSLYMGFMPSEDFYGGVQDLLRENTGALFIPCFIGMVIKNVINTIEMKQGMLRIIDYDVEERNMKIN